MTADSAKVVTRGQSKDGAVGEKGGAPSGGWIAKGEARLRQISTEAESTGMRNYAEPRLSTGGWPSR